MSVLVLPLRSHSSEVACSTREPPSTRRVLCDLGYLMSVSSLITSAWSVLLTVIDVFNRYADYQNIEHVVHVMKYIFPRQFKLHNVLTSTVDHKETAHMFKDYTLREQEIASAKRKAQARNASHEVKPCHLPRRLRNKAPLLVAKLLILHSRCSYVELLEHHCPTEPTFDLVTKELRTPMAHRVSSPEPRSPNDRHVTEFSTRPHRVSAFCRSVLTRLFPRSFWGQGPGGEENFGIIMHFVDYFVNCRKFENLTLHAVCNGLKVSCIDWLDPVSTESAAKMSLSDFNKRKEILYEFIYYLFDSLLVPLIRSNFHVTESNADKNRLYFFRHDIWKALTEPSLTSLKTSMFQEYGAPKPSKSPDANALSFSQLRLIPKGARFRPIMNLRRRATTMRNGKKVLDRAINVQLKPVHSMLNYEMAEQHDRLGASIFSIGDIHNRLKAFRDLLQVSYDQASPLYFAKVDVKSCFDTIPQTEMIQLLEGLCSHDKYRIKRHAEIRACDAHGHHRGTLSSTSKPARRFFTTANANVENDSFADAVNSGPARERKNTVFVELGTTMTESRQRLMQLLEEHVRCNRVKIGKKYYRQKQGIPQGSVLSSLLCSFFYGSFEEECLSFLNRADCLLLRLIDDFLLITTDKNKATRFLQVMYDGNATYGITIRPEKSLASFPCRVNGFDVPWLGDGAAFPYCGTVIDTKHLEISRDRARQQKNGRFNAVFGSTQSSCEQLLVTR